MPKNNGLFEANIILRRHTDDRCISLMKMWWTLWENALIKRDQPYLGFINFLTNNSIIYSLGYSYMLTDKNNYFFYAGRINKKNRVPRLIKRIRSELGLYRLLS
jgi:hypothetical protein